MKVLICSNCGERVDAVHETGAPTNLTYRCRVCKSEGITPDGYTGVALEYVRVNMPCPPPTEETPEVARALKIDRLALPYLVDLARDKTHLHIRSANGVSVADVHTQFGTPASTQERAEFIAAACNSYERREELLREALRIFTLSYEGSCGYPKCDGCKHRKEGYRGGCITGRIKVELNGGA